MISFGKDVIKFIFWYPIRLVLPFFPLRVVYLMGNIGGKIHMRLSKNLRQAMADELSAIFNGEFLYERRKSIIQRTFKIMDKNQLEVLLFKSLNKKKTDRIITVKGLEKIDSVRTKQKGAILLIAHFGANKLVMPALGYRGYKINQIAGNPKEWIRILGNELTPFSKKIFELEFENDQSLPANFIYVFKSMKPIFEHLKSNEIVCMAIDGGGGTKKEKVRFLGREAMISAGPFRISQKTGAPILPAFVVRQKDNTHKLIIEDPIHMESGPVEKENIDNKLQEFMNIFEKYVYEHPCHYTFRLARARILRQKDLVPLFNDYERMGRL